MVTAQVFIKLSFQSIKWMTQGAYYSCRCVLPWKIIFFLLWGFSMTCMLILINLTNGDDILQKHICAMPNSVYLCTVILPWSRQWALKFMEIKIAVWQFIFWFLELYITLLFLAPNGADDNIMCIFPGNSRHARGIHTSENPRAKQVLFFYNFFEKFIPSWLTW